MALPYRVRITVPIGDSRTIRFIAPIDQETFLPVDLADYDTITFAVEKLGEREPRLLRTLGAGVSIDPETNDILADLWSTDTRAIGLGRFILRLRLEDGETVAHTCKPLHELEITTASI